MYKIIYDNGNVTLTEKRKLAKILACTEKDVDALFTALKDGKEVKIDWIYYTLPNGDEVEIQFI